MPRVSSSAARTSTADARTTEGVHWASSSLVKSPRRGALQQETVSENLSFRQKKQSIELACHRLATVVIIRGTF